VKRGIRIGSRVRISDLSGIYSGREATVIEHSQIPMKQTGGGLIPDVGKGHYFPVDWRKEAAIQFDDGTKHTMFYERLTVVKGTSNAKE
jgi:hypothetical protein